MVGIGLVLQQELHNGQVTPSASQAQRCMVIIGSGLVDIGAFSNQKFGSAIMTGTDGLHQRRSASLGLVFQICTPFQ